MRRPLAGPLQQYTQYNTMGDQSPAGRFTAAVQGVSQSRCQPSVLVHCGAEERRITSAIRARGEGQSG